MPELPGRLLPVFVLDEYEGLEARLLQDFTRAQRDDVEANAEALREPAGATSSSRITFCSAARSGRRAVPATS